MKKYLLVIFILFPAIASAQTIGQFIPFLRWTNATGTNATTTTFSATTASTTNLYFSGTGHSGTNCLQVSVAGLVSDTGSACGSGSGGGNSKFATSSGPWLSLNPNGGTNVGVGLGTTTPAWTLQLASSTRSQLTLSDPSTLTNNHWSFRNAGGNFYLATSSAATFATSTNPTFSIITGGNTGLAGFGGTSTPWATLSVEQDTSSPSFVVSHNGSSTPSFFISGVNGNGFIGIGTSTPKWPLQVVSTSMPQLALSDGAAADNHFTFRAAGNFLYIGTSTPDTFATASPPFITLDSTNKRVGIFNTAPSVALHITGAFQTSGNITSGGNLAMSGNSVSNVSSVSGGSGSMALIGGTSVGSTLLLRPTNAVGVGADAIVFQLGSNGNVEYGRMTGLGFFGAGTTTPQWQMQLASSTRSQLTLSDAAAADNHWSFRNAGGILYIATSSPITYATSTNTAFWLDVNGGVNLGNYGNCNGTTNALGITTNLVQCDSLTSDARLKKNITDLPMGIETINALKPVSFYWKDNSIPGLRTGDKTVQYGFIAQDVQKVLPALVGTTSPTYLTPGETLTFNEQGLVPVLVNSVKQIWVRVLNHDARLSALEKENAELRARLDKLEAKQK